MIKIIYPYNISMWGEELKYSIRSLEKHFKEPYELWITGHAPDWMTGNFKKIQMYHKNFKQINKCRLFDLAHMFPEDEDFIWMNDDIYLIGDVDTNTLKTQWVMEDLSSIKHRGTSNWHKKLYKTYDFLKKQRCTTYNFECHIPNVFNVEDLLHTFERFQELDVWTMNTAHYNYNKYTDNIKDIHDIKIGRYKNNRHKPLPSDMSKYLFLNHDDFGLSEDIKSFLKNKFPEKSIYEN